MGLWGISLKIALRKPPDFGAPSDALLELFAQISVHLNLRYPPKTTFKDQHWKTSPHLKPTCQATNLCILV